MVSTGDGSHFPERSGDPSACLMSYFIKKRNANFCYNIVKSYK